jgi:hypothetical protein
MRVIALIDDPGVIRRILTPVGAWRERKGHEPGTAPFPRARDLVYEPMDDGWRG